MPCPSLREALLRAAIAALGANAIVFPILVRVKCRDGGLVLHAFHQHEWEALSAASEGTSPLTELQEDCLEAAEDKQWRSSQDLAKATGVEYTGYWRSGVAELLRRGLLERQPGTKRLRRTGAPHARPTDSDMEE